MLETIENRFQGRDYLVELGAPEFTSICPLTDAPDFGELTTRYVPHGKLYELKSLRDYLTSFRERKIFQEEVVNEVLEQLVADGAPRFVEVEAAAAAAYPRRAPIAGVGSRTDGRRSSAAPRHLGLRARRHWLEGQRRPPCPARRAALRARRTARPWRSRRVNDTALSGP